MGKSSTIAKLTGHTVPMSHVETPGRIGLIKLKIKKTDTVKQVICVINIQRYFYSRSIFKNAPGSHCESMMS